MVGSDPHTDAGFASLSFTYHIYAFSSYKLQLATLVVETVDLIIVKLYLKRKREWPKQKRQTESVSCTQCY